MKKLLAVVLLSIAAAGAAQAAESLTIVSKSDDGSVVKTDDGSVFEVESIDTIDSQLWLQGDEVVLTDDEDQLVNPDDESAVSVTRIR